LDFDALVLDRVVQVFHIKVKFTLVTTAPNEPPFVRRGVFHSAPLDVNMGNDTVFGDQETSIGIRLKDFPYQPERGDLIEIVEPNHTAFGQQYWIGDSDEDGQGGATLMLRKYKPDDLLDGSDEPS